MQRELEQFEHAWGQPGTVTAVRAPSADDAFQRWATNYWRLAASPGAAISVMRMNMEIDVRHILLAIRVPTLVLHRTDERVVHVEQARYLAARIPGAELVEFPGIDHTPFLGDVDAIVDKMHAFVTGVGDAAEHDRVLATILFMDIVRSTERAAELGDRRWRQLLEQYYATVRRELVRFRGREIDTAGDGLFASFDGPARGIRCAASVHDAVKPLSLDVRAGLHTGECEVVGEKLAGIAVHIGARVAAEATAGEVLVSNTVKDLVAGSGLDFESRGVHTLKGVPGEWSLFAVTTDRRQAEI
jgi:class 3 adenylate cyclase